MKNIYTMKTSDKILLGISAVVVTGLILVLSRRKDDCKVLSEVADEGYETAHDVLYPRQRKKFRKLHYGPVLPHSMRNRSKD